MRLATSKCFRYLGSGFQVSGVRCQEVVILSRGEESGREMDWDCTVSDEMVYAVQHGEKHFQSAELTMNSRSRTSAPWHLTTWHLKTW